jgi:hypothetical protein
VLSLLASIAADPEFVVFLGQLFGHGFNFLQADHIRVIVFDSIPTALFEHCP